MSSYKCGDCEYSEYTGEGCYSCSLEEGPCPHGHDEPKIEGAEEMLRMEIDSSKILDFMRRSIFDDFNREARIVMTEQIRIMTSEAFAAQIETVAEEEIEKIVRDTVQELMEEEFVVGDWRGSRTVKRRDYFLEMLEKQLDGDKVREAAQSLAKKHIQDFGTSLRNDINRNIKEAFDEVTRNTLTDSVVQLLMSSDTYKQMASSMGNLLPNGD